MALLDQYLQPGQSIEHGPDYHNELVRRLGALRPPEAFEIKASAPRVEVHYSDQPAEAPYALLPATVVVQDTTAWHGLDEETVVVDYALAGVGHLDRTRTGPGGAVVWTWLSAPEAEGRAGYAPRSWSAVVAGRPLPLSVTVTATARRLSLETHGPSVAEKGALAALAAAAGERRLVRGEAAVYAYDPEAESGDVASDYDGYWSLAPGPHWHTHGVAEASFVVARAYDPAFGAARRLELDATSAHVVLEEGRGEAIFFDRSRFEEDVSAVLRQVEAVFVDEAGLPLGNQGLSLFYKTSALVPEAERVIRLVATEPGRVRLNVTYTIKRGTGEGATTETALCQRHVRFYLPSRLGIAAADDPVLPSTIEVVPGNGRCRFRLGRAVRLVAFEKKGGSETPVRVVASSMRALNERLPTGGVELPVVVPQGSVVLSAADAVRAAAAAATLRQTLMTAAGGGLALYEITLEETAPGKTSGLLTIEPGELLAFPDEGVTLRIVRRLSTTLEEAPGTLPGALPGETMGGGGKRARYEVRGYLDETLLGREGHVTANCDLLVATMRFGYGNRQSPTFPELEHRVERVLVPGAMLPAFEEVLPQAQPQTFSDAWYVELTVSALWHGAAPVTRTLAWQRAEVVPGDPLDFTLTGEHDVYAVRLRESPYPFYGEAVWLPAVEAASRPVRPDDILALDAPLGTAFERPLLARHHGGAVLRVAGHYRGRAGSVQPAVQTKLSAVTLPHGTPVIASVVEDGRPKAGAPLTNGVFCLTGGRLWASVNGAWMLLSASELANTAPLVERVTLVNQANVQRPVTTVSANEYRGQLHVTDTYMRVTLAVRAAAGASIAKVEQTGGPSMTYKHEDDGSHSFGCPRTGTATPTFMFVVTDTAGLSTTVVFKTTFTTTT